MALIIGPITDTDDPNEAVVLALQDLQPATEHHHIELSPADPPPDSDGPLWQWTLSPDEAPPVLDPEITTFEGAEEHGHWTPTHPQAAAEIRHGLVLETEHGLVVVGVHEGEDDDITELAEQAMAHIQLIDGD